MSGPDKAVRQEQQRDEPALPGHFVSPELRSDCERFLDDVKGIVARRKSAKREPPPTKH